MSLRWTRAGIGFGEMTTKEKIISCSSWGRAWRRLLGWASDIATCWVVLVVVVVLSSAMARGLSESFLGLLSKYSDRSIDLDTIFRSTDFQMRSDMESEKETKSPWTKRDALLDKMDAWKGISNRSAVALLMVIHGPVVAALYY